MNESKPTLRDRLRHHTSRQGAFSAGTVLLVLAIFLVANLLIAQLPQHRTQFDMTDSGIYNITEPSKAYLKDLSQDVVLHVLADRDQLDPRISRFLSLYEELSDRLHVEYQDPMVFPSVLSEYDTDANTIVVTCEATGRQEIIPISEIIGVDLMQYYYSNQYVETDFDAEGLLTSAVKGVLSDRVQSVYQTTGHQETPLSSEVEGQLKKLHLSLASVNLLTDGGIPEDCQLLILNEPLRDLADDERTLLQEYLQTGGQVLCNLPGQLDPQPNLAGLLSDYGMDLADGMIADPQHSYQNNPYLFFPQVNPDSDLGGTLPQDATLLFFAARGFQVTDPVRETITVQPVLSTSSQGLSVVDETHQTSGTFTVGAVAEETIDETVTARLTVFGADSLVNEDLTQSFSNLDNTDLFLAAAAAGETDLQDLLIDPVPLSTPTNTISTGGIWALLFLLILPGTLLLCGLFRWMHRRKL